MNPTEDERHLSEFDQSTSEIEQRAADVDQTHSRSDQESSERDQISADHDQMAADIDQGHSDERDESTEDGSPREKTRRMRVVSARERAATTQARQISFIGRQEVARQRDRLSEARDIAGGARDALSASLEAETERIERQQSSVEGAGLNGGDRNGTVSLASKVRAHAAIQRKAAAEDRAQAAQDREAAALDRQSYAQELASFEGDELTGALRRRVGLSAVRREIDRTLRTGEQLTVVFVDVDGLKQTNDANGHAAGDALLRAVVKCVVEEFRSYDLIFRLGGDEFVCALSGDGLDGVASRFERIAARLHEVIPGATISTGVSVRQPQDTVESIIARADSAMIAARREDRDESQ